MKDQFNCSLGSGFRLRLLDWLTSLGLQYAVTPNPQIKNPFPRGNRVAAVAFLALVLAPPLGARASITIRVVPAISAVPILPTQKIKVENATPTISLAAAKGEYEPISFVIRSDERLTAVRLEPTRLIGKSGVLSANTLDVRVVKVWYQATGAWKSEYRLGEGAQLVPELLLHDDSLVRVDRTTRTNFLRLDFPKGSRYVSVTDPHIPSGRVNPPNSAFPVRDANHLLPLILEPHETKQFWLTVHVPATAAAGTYDGSLRLSADGNLLAEIPLHVEVLPFALAPPTLVYSVYYRGRLVQGDGTVSSEYKDTRQLRAELTNMLAHGIGNPTVYQLNPDPQAHRHDVAAEQKRLLPQYLEIRRAVGMAREPLYLLKTFGATEDAKDLKRVVKEVTALRKLATDYGATKLYVYGKDEAKHKALVAQNSVWKQIRRAGGRIFAAGSRGSYESMAALTDLLVLNGAPSKGDAARMHALGNKIFCYHFPQSGPENPALFRLNYGLRLWQANYDGAMVYAYQHAGGTGTVWNDFDNKKTRDLNLTYPTVEQPIDTLAWEGLREAVDDVRYIATLERLIDAAPGRTSDARVAKEYLARVRRADTADPDSVRRQVTGYIRLLLRSGSEN